jgi:protein SCO1
MQTLRTSHATRWSWVLSLGAALSLNCVGAAGAGDDKVAVHTPHFLSKGDRVSMQAIEVPDVAMLRADGRSVWLRRELDDGRPVVLNFVFTSCPGICPLMSQVFSQLQHQLGERSPVHMVSISIDPEQDTPARLREYAGKFSAGSHWQHYTGTVEVSQAVQRAFGVYNGDKMSHSPVTFIRGAPGEHWQRIDGLATATDLLAQYKALASTHLTASH